jgi:hypothetical protein
VVRAVMWLNLGRPRLTTVQLRVCSASRCASLSSAPGRLTWSPSTSPSQPSRSAWSMRAVKSLDPWPRTGRGPASGSSVGVPVRRRGRHRAVACEHRWAWWARGCSRVPSLRRPAPPRSRTSRGGRSDFGSMHSVRTWLPGCQTAPALQQSRQSATTVPSWGLPCGQLPVGWLLMALTAAPIAAVMVSAALSGTGRPASSQAITASTAMTGMSSEAH